MKYISPIRTPKISIEYCSVLKSKRSLSNLSDRPNDPATPGFTKKTVKVYLTRI